MKITIICRRGFGLQTTQFVVISRCCFAWDSYEMYKIFKRTCWAIVLLIKSIVFPCPRCRRRRGLLKVPNDEPLSSIVIKQDENRKSLLSRNGSLSLIPYAGIMATDFKRHLIYQLFLIFTATSYFPGEDLSLFALSISSICSGVKWSTKLKRKTELNRSLLRKFFIFFHPAICLLLPFVKMRIYELFSDAIFNVHANSRTLSEPTINEISPDWKRFSLFKIW